MFKVQVSCAFWPEQSDPLRDSYLFVYTIKITNLGTISGQLLSRHWVITDGLGHTCEVKGEGVVGLQPKLAPNEIFEYTSTCPLMTPYGTMHGTFMCVDEQGHDFEVKIPQFLLVASSSVQ